MKQFWESYIQYREELQKDLSLSGFRMGRHIELEYTMWTQVPRLALMLIMVGLLELNVVEDILTLQ